MELDECPHRPVCYRLGSQLGAIWQVTEPLRGRVSGRSLGNWGHVLDEDCDTFVSSFSFSFPGHQVSSFALPCALVMICHPKHCGQMITDCNLQNYWPK
jgi:hypothetical protein